MKQKQYILIFLHYFGSSFFSIFLLYEVLYSATIVPVKQHEIYICTWLKISFQEKNEGNIVYKKEKNNHPIS